MCFHLRVLKVQISACASIRLGFGQIFNLLYTQIIYVCYRYIHWIFFTNYEIPSVQICLQVGQNLLCFNHLSIHLTWNLWKHGNILSWSPFWNSSKHTLHVGSSSLLLLFFSWLPLEEEDPRKPLSWKPSLEDDGCAWNTICGNWSNSCNTTFKTC